MAGFGLLLLLIAKLAPCTVSLTVSVTVAGISGLVTTALLVMIVLAVSGVLTVTTKVIVIFVPAVMVTPLANVGGTVPGMPLPLGVRIMVLVT